ncbi:hypothetical protein I3843_10G066000 [Carya illinoinensis]|nr:hypothetical protein I3843_10G066000 [Carya illinoinensis]
MSFCLNFENRVCKTKDAKLQIMRFSDQAGSKSVIILLLLYMQIWQ